MGSRELLWPTFIGLFSVVIIHISETQRVHLFGESMKTSFDDQYVIHRSPLMYALIIAASICGHIFHQSHVPSLQTTYKSNPCLGKGPSHYCKSLEIRESK